MNWFKQNKFLATLLVVTLVVGGVLAFLMLSAQGTYAETEQRYDELSSELSRLQTAAPFPNAENLKKMEALRQEHQAAIMTLQKDLAAAEIPLEPLTPEQFQDLLDKTVKRVTAKAMEQGVELPKDRFYMGFDKYERDIPRAEAAAPLGRMLKAMEFVVMQLLENRVTQLTEIKREPLPEEGVAPSGAASSGRERESGSGRPGRDEPAEDAVKRHPFDIAFVAPEAKFHSFVNAIVTSKTQFLIPKSLTIKNEKEQGPSRIDPNAGRPPPPPPPDPNLPPTPPPDPNAPPQPPVPAVPVAVPSKYIVGDEKLQVAMKIEVVDFPAPTPVADR